MKRHWFYILLAVSARASYGTAIQDDVRTLSEGRERLWPATLYGSLEELRERGWIDEVDDRERPEGIAGRERFYRLTPAGRTALEAEVAHMQGVEQVARIRLAKGGRGA